ncbi:START domain-containing protein 10-like [Daphnia carinata]|uniref:START domain-containing protein 10-like n=1 Tax=Daphnia carinata TaxID=120202 RepID=UPI00257A0610|nr:START domain-containing protein 10-like [Daphnia carinata]XP_057377257.1 START domain-containing protein 10-like [Daphnia carinata]
MEVGMIQVTADEDFEKLWQMVSDNSWKLEYQHEEINVWSKHSNSTDLKIVKVKTTFPDVDMWLLFDLLMDGEYRPVWDTCMVASYTIGYINPNNDVGYYAMSCPPPIQNRDFVLQRSWLATPKKISILNHSVTHKDLPPKKYFIRGVSHITGYVIEPLPGKSKGLTLAYVSATDPRGAIPTWAVNKGTQYFAPKMMKTLHKACRGYLEWKQLHSPGFKPWLYPEQMDHPKLLVEQESAVNGNDEIPLNDKGTNGDSKEMVPF